MHIPALLQERFSKSLAVLTDSPEEFASMIRPTSDPKHGDYQANFAMSLSKQLRVVPRELATKIVAQTDLTGLCDPPQIAGPGFINVKLSDDFVLTKVKEALCDDRCGVGLAAHSSSIVIDFSSPNVAKPMHVGHIRSTVIGDSLARVLRFLGHQTITDNHLGDWGTQFGIIIYGYKHFGDPQVVSANPVPELANLYRQVNSLIEYRKSVKRLPDLQQTLEATRAVVAELQAHQADPEDKKAAKKHRKSLTSAQRKVESIENEISAIQEKIAEVQADPERLAESQRHQDVDQAVLEETAKLHRGDEENRRLWREFLPHCKDEINRIYSRLRVEFDHTLGESHYHSMLGSVVEKLRERGLATDSDGAVCVFLDGFDAPMIVQKKDGAFLYATTDLATLRYRLDEFNPQEILYVVDTRQSEHFEKVFAVAHEFGLENVKLVHVNFGTVLATDGRPMKTRSGTLIGLEGLLNDAVDRAREVVCDPERLALFDPPMNAQEQQSIAEAVGIGAIKFADLGHHRSSDYRFNLNKMVALEGNTSAYVQYSYARTQAILNRVELGQADVVKLADEHELQFTHEAERALAVKLLQFEEALLGVHKEYAPNILVDYLLETARIYSRFNDSCSVLKAESASIKTTRLVLVTLAGRVLAQGLDLLGVNVVPRM